MGIEYPQERKNETDDKLTEDDKRNETTTETGERNTDASKSARMFSDWASI